MLLVLIAVVLVAVIIGAIIRKAMAQRRGEKTHCEFCGSRLKSNFWTGKFAPTAVDVVEPNRGHLDRKGN